MEIKAITNKIVLLKFTTQRDLASALIRFQEYYESPIPEIKNQIFTLGQLRSLYSNSARSTTGAFTYMEGSTHNGDWYGFNFS